MIQGVEEEFFSLNVFMKLQLVCNSILYLTTEERLSVHELTTEEKLNLGIILILIP